MYSPFTNTEVMAQFATTQEIDDNSICNAISRHIHHIRAISIGVATKAKLYKGSKLSALYTAQNGSKR